MSLTIGRKAEIIKDYATKSGDTGSPEVQVAILSERITTLACSSSCRSAASCSIICGASTRPDTRR